MRRWESVVVLFGNPIASKYHCEHFQFLLFCFVIRRRPEAFRCRYSSSVRPLQGVRLVVSLGAYITYWFPLPSSHILYPSGNTPITLSLSALACFSGYMRSSITYFIFCYRAAGVARINDSTGLYALASLCASQLAFKP